VFKVNFSRCTFLVHAGTPRVLDFQYFHSLYFTGGRIIHIFITHFQMCMFWITIVTRTVVSLAVFVEQVTHKKSSCVTTGGLFILDDDLTVYPCSHLSLFLVSSVVGSTVGAAIGASFQLRLIVGFSIEAIVVIVCAMVLDIHSLPEELR